MAEYFPRKQWAQYKKLDTNDRILSKFAKTTNEQGPGIDALLNEMEPRARRGEYDGQKTNTSKDRNPELWEINEFSEIALPSRSVDTQVESRLELDIEDPSFQLLDWSSERPQNPAAEPPNAQPDTAAPQKDPHNVNLFINQENDVIPGPDDAGVEITRYQDLHELNGNLPESESDPALGYLSKESSSHTA